MSNIEQPVAIDNEIKSKVHVVKAILTIAPALGLGSAIMLFNLAFPERRWNPFAFCPDASIVPTPDELAHYAFRAFRNSGPALQTLGDVLADYDALPKEVRNFIDTAMGSTQTPRQDVATLAVKCFDAHHQDVAEYMATNYGPGLVWNPAIAQFTF